MAKPKQFRFRINTGWQANTDRAVVISGGQAYYERQFTSVCVNILYCVLKPLTVARQGKSRSEVLLAITEAKSKLDIYFDEAMTMVTIQSLPSSAEGPAPQPSQAEVDTSDLPASEKSVYSQQVENIFEDDDD